MLRENNIGVHVNGVHIGCLFWADDVVLLANDDFELQKMLDLAAKFSTLYKLQFNHEKSNVLVVGKRIDKQRLWQLGNDCILETNSYKYLGCIFNRTLSDHSHIQEVIKKGNRIIGYIKSIIDGQDDFNRVYYGDLLWKSLALPSINFACAAWVCGGSTDIHNLEKLQIHMARNILKASRTTCKEALYGDLGWQSIAAIQDCHRIKYLDRLLALNNSRWPKLAFNNMFITHNSRSIKWKWLDHIKLTLEECDMVHILNTIVPSNRWVNICSERLKTIDHTNLLNQAKEKSSLWYYVNLKSSHNLETYLLDKTDFYGVNLKFKARSNTLPLNSRTSRWNKDHDESCSLCKNGAEDIIHFLFTCKSLNEIRIEEYTKLEDSLFTINYHDVWFLFIAGDLQMKLMLTLGNTSPYSCLGSAENISSIFDQFCKTYIKRAWHRRNVIINDI